MSKTEHNASSPAPSKTSQSGGGAIDIQKLTDKVYQLMLDELRLERRRGGEPPRRRGQ